MTVLQGPVLYLHFPLTYKTELFSKKVQKVVQNGVQKRGPPDELCNAQILVFACFFSVPEFRDTEFCQSTAGCIDASGRQMPVHKINKNCHNPQPHTQTDRHISFQAWAQRKKRFAQKHWSRNPAISRPPFRTRKITKGCTRRLATRLC